MAEMQRALTTSEQDRRVLQERFDNTRLDDKILCFVHLIEFNQAIVRLCDSVCPHDKTKTAETRITKLGTGIVHHDTSLIN